MKKLTKEKCMSAKGAPTVNRFYAKLLKLQGACNVEQGARALRDELLLLQI